MREIKFRGWHKVHRQMIDLHAVTVFAMDAQLQEQDGLYLPFVDYITLMQFTGLRDLYGQDIYEGDIVKSRSFGNWNRIVKWEDYHGWTLQQVDQKDGTWIRMEVWQQCEVIGNIYENPELLKLHP